jgi:hypothetical protein
MSSTPTRAQCSRFQAQGSRFKSFYVDDTAGEVIAASKLIVSHFRRFGPTIHTAESKRENEK